MLTERGFRGTWLAQSVEHPTLDFGSGHDLTVHEFKPRVRLCADSTEPAWDSWSPSLSAPPPLMLCLKLKKKKSCQFLGVSYLVGALHTPHVGTFPSDVAILAVIVAILLL